MTHNENETNDRNICEILAQIRDDQRMGLDITKSVIRLLKTVLWSLLVVILIMGTGAAIFLYKAIERIDSMPSN